MNERTRIDVGRRITRRGFVQGIAGAAGGVWASRWETPARAAGPRNSPPRIAAIITEYRPFSHADVIVGRALQGYLLGVSPHRPRARVVSMYLDQHPKGDLGPAMAAHHGLDLRPTIAEALTRGGNELAVDGVLLIGEHGDYPYNEKKQHMYPRRRFFEQIVDTYRKTGRSAPVFNDKHLGYAWADAKWMVDQAREMKFGLMAGSSLPTTWRKPELEIPVGTAIEDALVVAYGGVESYGFHALETLQCMTERRAGGETGVAAVECLEGPAVWEAGRAGRWSRTLLTAALDRAEEKKAGDPEANCPNPAAYLITYRDGLKATVLMLNGHTTDFCFAAKVRGETRLLSTLFWLQEPEWGHFSYLLRNIESMFLTGEPTYPAERTLLTTGILDAVMTSRFEQHRRVDTPWLAKVHYRPTTRYVARGSFRV